MDNEAFCTSLSEEAPADRRAQLSTLPPSRIEVNIQQRLFNCQFYLDRLSSANRFIKQTVANLLTQTRTLRVQLF